MHSRTTREVRTIASSATSVANAMSGPHWTKVGRSCAQRIAAAAVAASIVSAVR